MKKIRTCLTIRKARCFCPLKNGRNNWLYGNTVYLSKTILNYTIEKVESNITVLHGIKKC